MSAIGDFSFNLFMFPFEKIVLHKFRRDTVSTASGDVLELGAGTGVNFKYYNKNELNSISILDLKISDSVRNVSKGFSNIKLFEGSAENLPFPDSSFDTVVFTLVFCSVDNPERGLSEVHRVLRDNGKIIFIEHVEPESKRVKAVAEKVNSAWNSFSNGCNINRQTLQSIISSGFSLKPDSYKRKGVFITGTAMKI